MDKNTIGIGMYTSRARASSACLSSARLNCTRARARDKLQNLGLARLVKGNTLFEFKLALVHYSSRVPY
jgi:hypothetical protein